MDKKEKNLQEIKQKIKRLLKEIYRYCKLELHHICPNGDNRIDNIIYLPKFIHDKVNHN